MEVHDIVQKTEIKTIPMEKCQEPARDIPLVTKVMRKEAQHTQRRDRASGVPPDILEHLPPNLVLLRIWQNENSYFVWI